MNEKHVDLMERASDLLHDAVSIVELLGLTKDQPPPHLLDLLADGRKRLDEAMQRWGRSEKQG